MTNASSATAAVVSYRLGSPNPFSQATTFADKLNGLLMHSDQEVPITDVVSDVLGAPRRLCVPRPLTQALSV